VAESAATALATHGRRASDGLTVSGLSKAFGDVQALDDVHLVVPRGEVTVVVGESGAGKTTLVRCLAGDLTPDAGSLTLDGLPLGASPAAVQTQGVAIVWQDLAVCEELDAVSNLFLGDERGRVWLTESVMAVRARALLDDLGLDVPHLRRPLRLLPTGQQQQIAIAGALRRKPRLLVLDELTTGLEAAQAAAVVQLARRAAQQRAAVLLVTHAVDRVFGVADRIVVLRHGHVVAELRPSESHPDDVMALMSGVEVESTARRQLRNLQSLVDQLSEVTTAESLPLIVSAMAAALGQESLCVHLLDRSGPDPVLRRSAAVGMPPGLLARNAVLAVGSEGGSVGLAAETGVVVVAEDVRTHPAWARFRDAATATGIASAWAAPIAGSDGLLGTVSGYARAPGRLSDDQQELVALYAGYAAAAIERDDALDQVTRHNRVLTSLHDVLQSLTGPEPVDGGVAVALSPLRRGLGATAVALVETHDGTARITAGDAEGEGERQRAGGRGSTGDLDGDLGMEPLAGAVASAVEGGVVNITRSEVARIPVPRGGHLATVPVWSGDVVRLLAASWSPPAVPAIEADALLAAAARSLRLAFEREQVERARKEAIALRRSRDLQREFLSRLSHELRTPLTAIHGFADSLLQADVTWDAATQRSFLDRIATESSRLSRLVTDLLDASAIESGVLRLNPDWCDVMLVVRAARELLPADAPIVITADPDVPAVLADHDRLEQVFVNLLGNAVEHTPPGTAIRIHAATCTDTPASGSEAVGDGKAVQVTVSDEGPGIPPELRDVIFKPHVRGNAGGAGLGLSIAKGIVQGHGGRLELVERPDGTTFIVTLRVEPERMLNLAGGDGGGDLGEVQSDEG
jgi:signal transduction histidine kinase/ABC-type multidrug transport system ATPase subunit